jgi:hypothetical protein
MLRLITLRRIHASHLSLKSSLPHDPCYSVCLGPDDRQVPEAGHTHRLGTYPLDRPPLLTIRTGSYMLHGQSRPGAFPQSNYDRRKELKATKLKLVVVKLVRAAAHLHV